MGKMKFFGIIYIMLAMSITGVDLSPAMGNSKMVEEKTIVEVAREEAINLGYDLKTMRMETSFHENSWNDYFPKECLTDYCLAQKDKLKNKKYWAVYFYPSSDSVQKGGDVCIFIDAKTGIILTTYRGK